MAADQTAYVSCNANWRLMFADAHIPSAFDRAHITECVLEALNGHCYRDPRGGQANQTAGESKRNLLLLRPTDVLRASSLKSALRPLLSQNDNELKFDRLFRHGTNNALPR
jgi:hypothetical protein